LTTATIALDLDDTLVDTTSVLLAWLERRTGKRLADAKLVAYELGTDAAETDALVAAFHAERMDQEIHALDGAAEACRSLVQASFRLVVVTSRKSEMSARTVDLVERCFPDIFAEIRSIGYTADKSATLRDLDAALFVDDHFRHVERAFAAGIPSILFRDLPWSRDKVWPHRAADWSEAFALGLSLLRRGSAEPPRSLREPRRPRWQARVGAVAVRLRRAQGRGLNSRP
jgi:FMN phosphatase YigB (HAD superfamily)